VVRPPVAELVPPGFTCPACGGTSFRKEEDILDVWFDSGVSFAAVVEKRPELGAHADLYLEGSDQHRGWFQSSLLASVATRDRAPFDTVLTHGFFLDEDARKMSKSKGNVVAPQKIVATHGADILRLWVSAEDYREDMRISREILERAVEAYRRIRNTARFLLGNLADFDPGRDAVPQAQLLELDRFVLDRLQGFVARCVRAYDAFEFHTVYHALNNFCSVDLSAIYLDVVKDRLYCEGARSTLRRSAQTALYAILDALVRVMAPILPSPPRRSGATCRPTRRARERAPRRFSASRPGARRRRARRRLAAAPRRACGGHEGARGAAPARRDRPLARGERPARRRRRSRHAAREPAHTAARDPDRLAGRAVASGALPGESTLPGLAIEAARAGGQKCARCWNWRLDVGSDRAFRPVCGRCAGVLASSEARPSA